jgi:PTH2 family peptidyl-tRNA hydrolase
MFKQVIVVRSDIKMSVGKLAAHVAHAAVEACARADSIALDGWRREGQKKVVLSVNTEEALIALRQKCDAAKICNSLITDAGNTELSPGTVTALGIGPDVDERINSVTGSLPLLT